METFWEFVYDWTIMAIKAVIALVVVQVACVFFDLDFHVPFVAPAVDFIFHALRLR